MDSLLRFESTIKSEVTKKNYKRSLDLFKKFIQKVILKQLMLMID